MYLWHTSAEAAKTQVTFIGMASAHKLYLNVFVLEGNVLSLLRHSESSYRLTSNGTNTAPETVEARVDESKRTGTLAPLLPHCTRFFIERVGAIADRGKFYQVEAMVRYQVLPPNGKWFVRRKKIKVDKMLDCLPTLMHELEKRR